MTRLNQTTEWRKSSWSNEEENCVEVARLVDGIAVRDSKNPAAGHLATTPLQWSAFVTALKRGSVDLPG